MKLLLIFVLFQQEKHSDLFSKVEVVHKKVYRKNSYFSDEEELID